MLKYIINFFIQNWYNKTQDWHEMGWDGEASLLFGGSYRDKRVNFLHVVRWKLQDQSWKNYC